MDSFSKYDQIRSFLRIWSHLQKKSFKKNFILWAVLILLFLINNTCLATARFVPGNPPTWLMFDDVNTPDGIDTMDIDGGTIVFGAMDSDVRNGWIDWYRVVWLTRSDEEAVFATVPTIVAWTFGDEGTEVNSNFKKKQNKYSTTYSPLI